MGTIIKTVKQYSYELDEDTLKELLFIANQYKNVKNYVYSRFSGINSIPLIGKDRKIRDEWTHNEFYKQWKLPARYWKLALHDAMANIKSIWSNTKIKIRDCVRANKNLSDDDRHYIYSIIKFNNYYWQILTYKSFEIPKIFENKNLNFRYLNNLIRRYTRKFKSNIPYSKIGRSFSIDTGLYSYTRGGIRIASTEWRKRMPINLTDSNVHCNTLIVKLVGKTIEIHCPLTIKTKPNKNSKNVIGIDKGYKCVFTLSNGKFYGEKLNKFLNEETERLEKSNKNRTRFWNLYYKYLKINNNKKANKIKENNLGNIKYIKNKLRHDQTVKSYINHSLNQLIKEEKPTEIVMENLDFVNWSGKYPKLVKRNLSRWIKGYIRERLEYKCDFNSIKYTYINPAYTSKVCSSCGSFGLRRGDVFTCPKCGNMQADLNASKNILNRKLDKEITLHTPYKEVKKILENRNK